MERRLQLVEHGPQLWTRDLARKIRGEVVRLLAASQPGDVVVIDAKGVEVFDYSFANELFGKTVLSLRQEHPGRFVVVENLTTYTEENLIKALDGLGLAMIQRKRKRLDLIGKVHPTDSQTFTAIVQAMGPVTAASLKEQLGVNLTAMNERLAKLTDLGLIRRETTTSPAGRVQYQYSVFC